MGVTGGKCLTLCLFLLSTSLVVTVSSTSLLDYCDKGIDLTLILDQSESLRDEDPYDKPDQTWNLVKDFAKALIRKLPISQHDINVALIKYSNSAKLEWPLDRYYHPNDLLNAIDRLECEGGNTNTAAALRMAYNQIYRDRSSYRRNVVVIFTDGMSTVGQHQVSYQAGDLWGLPDTEVYAVAVGKYIDDTELKNLVNQQFGQYLIHIPAYDRLPAFEDLLIHRVCGLPDPEPPSDEDCQAKKMDLTFIVDSSGSIKESLFTSLKEYLVTMVSKLEIGPDMTRIAAVSFSDTATREFSLGDYNDVTHLKYKLMNLEFKNGNTNMSGAFRVTMQQVYSGNNGDRQDVTDVAVLITDGASTLEKSNTIPEAIRAKLRGIQIYAIGVTNKVSVYELHQMVSKPIREHYFDSTHVRYLNSVLINLIKNICVNSEI